MAEKPLVAIVDDDKSIRNATRDLFRAAGYSSATFEDAKSFLASASRAIVACLVTDFRMPGMTGLELFEALVAVGRRHSHRADHRSPGRGDARACARSRDHVLPQQAIRSGRPPRMRARSAGENAARVYTKVLSGNPLGQR